MYTLGLLGRFSDEIMTCSVRLGTILPCTWKNLVEEKNLKKSMIETVRSHAMSKEGNYASFPHKLHIKINVQSNRKEKSTQKFDNEATKSVNLDFPTFLLPT